MFFNSIEFAIFLPIVFCLYWLVFNKTLKAQNFLIFVSSYVFYGWWDWRFLFLIFASTVIDFYIALLIPMQKDKTHKKLLLFVSFFANLGLLFAFKYFNFFAGSFNQAFTVFGSDFAISSLQIILPVGISFYTFQTLSYTIDVYRGSLKPTRNFVDFAAFVSFFPQLVAGPIERASNLLPQIMQPRQFSENEAKEGLKQILWGLFKKIVIADNCATYANAIFSQPSSQSGSTLAIGIVFFAFQIYGDFSGYSDIAIGTARLFGFKLMKNFAYPYFSRDVSEFWRRWHISLSTWFRDYVYIPMGGNKGTMGKTVANTLILFLVSGLWHGANWTFIIWGALNALLIIPLVVFKRNHVNRDIVAKGKKLPSFKEFFSIVSTFACVSFTWIFFRAENTDKAVSYISGMWNWSIFSIPQVDTFGVLTLLCIGLLIVIEWIGREEDYPIASLGALWPALGRWQIYYVFIALIVFMGGQSQEFIYFQF